MADHAAHEEEKGVVQGRIDDLAPTLTGFRAAFADDIAVEMMLPKDTDEHLGPFLRST
jgi:hypothetical protein